MYTYTYIEYNVSLGNALGVSHINICTHFTSQTRSRFPKRHTAQTKKKKQKSKTFSNIAAKKKGPNIQHTQKHITESKTELFQHIRYIIYQM